MLSCYGEDDPNPRNYPQLVHRCADVIKGKVRSGAILPVEGFAQTVDFAYWLFGRDYRGMMWALTHVITGFEPNTPLDPIWNQARRKAPPGVFFIGQDWLPYQNNPEYNDDDWGGTGTLWVHSRRGDWRKEYWDKTSNQAYHFWFYAASTFFDVAGAFWSYGMCQGIWTLPKGI